MMKNVSRVRGIGRSRSGLTIVELLVAIAINAWFRPVSDVKRLRAGSTRADDAVILHRPLKRQVSRR